MHHYSENFFEYIEPGSTASALAILPLILSEYTVQSVLDVGCGQGAWLAACKKLQHVECRGLDGPYVDQTRLMCEPHEFMATDLSRPFNLGKTFDLVLCLEVAEHLPSARAESLINDLVQHGKVVLFSAAVPGQGGEHHINEQPYEYWRHLFAQHGYHALDVIRPAVQQNHNVEWWYRYNSLLYCHESVVAKLSQRWRESIVKKSHSIPIVAPVSFRLRAAILRQLPPYALTEISRLKQLFMRA